jgi:transposase
MLLADHAKRILAYRNPVDMRKQFTGLVALVQSALGKDPLSGDLFVFFNRRRTILKAVYWDRTGYCLFSKRLEQGRFVLPGTETTHELDDRTLQLILDGIHLGRKRHMR